MNHTLEKQEISCQARIQCRVSELDRFGRGKQVLVVIVINQPVVCKVALPQPRGGDLIYRQEPHGWEKIPPQVPTLRRSLTLNPPDDKDALADLDVDYVGGSWGGGREISKAPK